MSNWDENNLVPYEYNFQHFKQPVNICLAVDSNDFSIPINTYITSGYGRRHGRNHNGIDLDLNTGDTVVSAFDGVVRMARYYYGFGYLLVIRHQNGLETVYAHLSKFLVIVGDKVSAGQSIGLGGNTGHSSGSHLHFEIRFLGQPINPDKFISFESFTLFKNEVRIDSTFFDNHSKSSKHLKQNLHGEITQKPKKEPKKTFHTIKKGDNLGAIARKHKTTVSKICKLNNIKPTTKLKPGRKLRIK